MSTEPNDTYHQLIALLDTEGAAYRVIDHEAEGRTDLVSPMRGNALSAAAKCMVLLVKPNKRTTLYVLAVVPGDRRVDFAAVARLYAAAYVAIASRDVAEELARSVSGTILPFVLDDRLELVVDPALLEEPELYFNAARLDRSVAIATADYVRIARPRLATISATAQAEVERPQTGIDRYG